MELRRLSIHVVGAAILDGGRCLAVERSASMSTPLKWEFPGGKVEDGEDPREALVREIREELRLEIEVGRFLGRGIAQADGRKIVLDVYLSRLSSGSLELREHSASRWLGPVELDSVDWADADVPVLGALAEVLERGQGRTRSTPT